MKKIKIKSKENKIWIEKLQSIKKLGHRLASRRDFLGQGLIAFSAVSFFPWRKALGGFESGFETDPLPFMVFDMAGGAALPGNFLVGKTAIPEEGLLSSYNTLGWDPREAGGLNRDFGLPMSAKYSKILQGILENTSPAVRPNFKMGSFCHFAQDDTASNRLNASSLILKSGLRGKLITNGLGTTDSFSGGQSSQVLYDPNLRPIFVRNVSDVIRSAHFGGSSFQDFSESKVRSLIQGEISLRDQQISEYLGGPEGEEFENLTKAAYGKSLDLINSVDGLDPRENPITRAVYGIDANSDPSAVNTVVSALSLNTINGTSGPSVWALGGCDYHTGNQTEGDGKDHEMGVQLGRSVELAYRLKKPFFFQLLTDGGVSSSPGTRNWAGDSGIRCMTIIGYFNPIAAPEMLRQQVGYYTDGQGAERTTLIGNDPALVGYAVLANYLNVQGRLSEFANLAPGIFPTATQLRSVLLFKGKT